jgi:hypothetical protein
MLGGSAIAASLANSASIGANEPLIERRPQGYFALQPGHPAVLEPGSSRVVPDRLIELPHVAGLTIRARWAWIHPTATSTDYTFLEAQAARCRRLGKGFKILVMTGVDSSPRWLPGGWHASAPVPWGQEVREQYAILVRELGELFAEDPACVGTHITGPTYPSAEMHPAPSLESVKGYSVDAMAGAWKASIDAYAAAFPHTAACLSISVRGAARRYVNEVISYGRAALGDRFAVQHNALKASTLVQAPHQQLVAAAARDGVRTGYEMVCAAATNPRRFGSNDVKVGIAIGRAAGGTYWDVYPPDLKFLT